MAITRVCYATREAVKRAVDSKMTARDEWLVDEAIQAVAEQTDELCHRVFYPTLATRYKDWPPYDRGPSYRLWLDRDEIISLTSLSSGGTTIAAANYNLEPVNTGPPYTHIEIKRDTTAKFGGGATPQRDVTMVGLFGHSNNTATAGTIAEALDATETDVDVSNSAAIGVGDLIQVDSERMLVTGKTMITTGQTLQVNMDALASATTASVTTGSSYSVDETILLNSERMLIVDISTNDLIVIRAWDGTVLASHSGSTVLAPRTLTVVRGMYGTTAATHSSGAAITRWAPPPLIRSWNIAEAIDHALQHGAGWSRTVGSGDAEREASGRNLEGLRKRALKAHKRKTRQGAI